ncbi:MAG: hypothetical protein WCL32_07460, partial [Planctomycetota bacterium]
MTHDQLCDGVTLNNFIEKEHHMNDRQMAELSDENNGLGNEATQELRTPSAEATSCKSDPTDGLVSAGPPDT